LYTALYSDYNEYHQPSQKSVVLESSVKPSHCFQIGNFGLVSQNIQEPPT